MLPAHVDEHLHLPTTLPRTWQSGIVVLRFVNGLAAKIGNPRFDVPRGYEYKNSLVARSDGTSLASALSVQLIHTSLNTSVVAVHHHNQRSRHASAPMFNEFSRKACPHVLLGGAFSFGRHLYSKTTGIPPRPLQKPSRERLLLLIFTEQHDLDSSAHPSQPLAISSESFSPAASESETSGRRVVTTPDESRCKRTPFSEPR